MILIPQNTSQSLSSEYLKNMQLVLFKSDFCPHCNKALSDLKKEGLLKYFTVLDCYDYYNPLIINIINEYQLSPHNGVPLFLSLKTKKDFTGYNGNIDDIINNLF